MNIKNALFYSIIFVNSVSNSVGLSPAFKNDQLNRDFIFDKFKAYESFFNKEVRSYQNSITLRLKVCKTCDGSFPISSNNRASFFYPIKADGEKKLRWEENCKGCKKNNRKRRNEQKQKNDLKSEIVFDGEEKFSSVPKRILITDNAIAEGIKNFNIFVSVLLEEYGKQVGASVYVKGKRS